MPTRCQPTSRNESRGACNSRPGTWLTPTPRSVGGLYDRPRHPRHGGPIGDPVSHLPGNERQLPTNAHPLVEITIVRQPKQSRIRVHFIHLSGHSQTASFDPREMRDIEVETNADLGKDRSVKGDRQPAVRSMGEKGRFTLPRLGQHDVAVQG